MNLGQEEGRTSGGSAWHNLLPRPDASSNEHEMGTSLHKPWAVTGYLFPFWECGFLINLPPHLEGVQYTSHKEASAPKVIRKSLLEKTKDPVLQNPLSQTL